MEYFLLPHIILVGLFLLVISGSLAPFLKKTTPRKFRTRWQQWLYAHLVGGGVGVFIGCLIAYIAIEIFYSLAYPTGYGIETPSSSLGIFVYLFILVAAGGLGSLSGFIVAGRIDHQTLHVGDILRYFVIGSVGWLFIAILFIGGIYTLVYIPVPVIAYLVTFGVISIIVGLGMALTRNDKPRVRDYSDSS